MEINNETQSSGTTADLNQSISVDSDGDEEGCNVGKSGMQERRRQLHTAAEQRRRNAIKNGFEMLHDLVRSNKASPNSARLSKDLILKRTNNLIKKRSKDIQQHQLERDTLEKEVLALEIINREFNCISNLAKPDKTTALTPISEEWKLQVFQSFMDPLFDSFDENVTPSSFPQLTGSLISWIEQRCTAESLSCLMETVLADTIHQTAAYVNQPNSSATEPHPLYAEAKISRRSSSDRQQQSAFLAYHQQQHPTPSTSDDIHQPIYHHHQSDGIHSMDPDSTPLTVDFTRGLRAKQWFVDNHRTTNTTNTSSSSRFANAPSLPHQHPQYAPDDYGSTIHHSNVDTDPTSSTNRHLIDMNTFIEHEFDSPSAFTTNVSSMSFEM